MTAEEAERLNKVKLPPGNQLLGVQLLAGISAAELHMPAACAPGRHGCLMRRLLSKACFPPACLPFAATIARRHGITGSHDGCRRQSRSSVHSCGREHSRCVAHACKSSNEDGGRVPMLTVVSREQASEVAEAAVNMLLHALAAKKEEPPLTQLQVHTAP